MSGSSSDYDWASYDGPWAVFHFIADAVASDRDGNVTMLTWIRGGSGGQRLHSTL